MVLRAYIQEIMLFKDVSAETVDTVARASKVHSYKKGELVYSGGGRERPFIYIIDGCVKIYHETTDGEEVVVDVLSKFEHFGEHFIFDSKEAHYGAQAVEDLELLTVPSHVLKKLISTDNRLSLNMLQHTLAKSNEVSMEMEHIAIQSAAQRIGCFLLRLACQSDKPNAILKLPYDKTVLASQLAMRSETFSRALAKLSSECDVKIEGDVVHLTDIPKISAHVCYKCSKVYPCETKKGT